MKAKILIAEDDTNIRLGLTATLESEGYAVTAATDGAQALRLFAQEKFSLLILDVMMPKKSGFEVCQELRANEAVKDTLVLMLTAKGRDTDIAQGLGVGADGYMTKPFATKDLAARVRQMLE